MIADLFPSYSSRQYELSNELTVCRLTVWWRMDLAAVVITMTSSVLLDMLQKSLFPSAW